MGLFRAMIDSMLGAVDALAGRSVTKLTAELSETATSSMSVTSNIRFGAAVDDQTSAIVLINGELIYAQSRSSYTTFNTLTRGYDTTKIRKHPVGSLVYDMSQNRTALDHAKRGLFVRTARQEDLDIVGRNLGLHKCPGLTEAQWRSIIEVMAYLPNQPIDAIKRVLDVYPGVGQYEVVEDLVTDPNQLTVRVTIGAGASRLGRFFLNGGVIDAVDGGGTTVTLPYSPTSVQRVVLADDITRNGKREGITNLYSSLAGAVITLNAPQTPGAAVIVDLRRFTGHYLALDETKRYPTNGQYFPYLSDPSAIVSCLLNQVKAAGVRVNFVTVLS